MIFASVFHDSSLEFGQIWYFLIFFIYFFRRSYLNSIELADSDHFSIWRGFYFLQTFNFTAIPTRINSFYLPIRTTKTKFSGAVTLDGLDSLLVFLYFCFGPNFWKIHQIAHKLVFGQILRFTLSLCLQYPGYFSRGIVFRIILEMFSFQTTRDLSETNLLDIGTDSLSLLILRETTLVNSQSRLSELVCLHWRIFTPFQ